MKRRLFVVLTVLVSVACSAPAATPTTAPVAAPAPTAAPTRASTVTAVPTSAPATATPLSRTTPSATGAEWPHANFDYANTRAAVNSSISSGNVNQLGVAWTFGVSGVSTFGALATSPVVVNGTVYLQDLKSNVYAIDLLTGTLKWQKQYNADNLGPNGPAVDGGKVFVESSPQTVAALNAETGNELWSVQIAPPPTQ